MTCFSEKELFDLFNKFFVFWETNIFIAIMGSFSAVPQVLLLEAQNQSRNQRDGADAADDQNRPQRLLITTRQREK